LDGYDPPAASSSAVTSLAPDEVVLVEKFKVIKGELWAKLKATGKHIPASCLRRFANVQLDENDFASDGVLDEDDFASDDDARAETRGGGGAAARAASGATSSAAAAAPVSAEDVRSDDADEGSAVTMLQFDTPSELRGGAPGAVGVATTRADIALPDACAARAPPTALDDGAAASVAASLLSLAPRPTQMPPPHPDTADATAATRAVARDGAVRKQ